MPTTAEVEARLRRTAEACEPLVDELMRDDHPLAPAPPGARPTRSGRVGWLVAAGLVVAGVGAGVLVVNADDGPSDEVRATTPDTLFDRTTTTAPAAGHPAIATPLTLADGTEAVLSIPGPERWTARFAEVDVDLPQVEGGPLTVSLGAYADDPTVEERISERAYIGTWGSGRSLFVEIDGWTASLPLAGVDGILPDALVAEVAETLTFRVGPNGPTDISGAGLTVVEARAALTRERDVNGMEATLTVAHDPDGRHPTCVGHPPVSGLSRTQRCVADDQLLLTARGSTTQSILPGIDGRVGAAEPAPGQQVAVSFADGTQAVVTIPGDDPWPIAYAGASVTIDGVESRSPLPIVLRPESGGQTAGRIGGSFAVIESGRYLATDPTGARTLIVEYDGWTAALALDGPDRMVSDQVLERLVRTLDLEALDAGPTSLAADGMEIVEMTAVFGDPGDSARPETADALVLQLVAASGCEGEREGPGRRCLDGEMAVLTRGPSSQAVIDGITAEVVRPG